MFLFLTALAVALTPFVFFLWVVDRTARRIRNAVHKK